MTARIVDIQEERAKRAAYLKPSLAERMKSDPVLRCRIEQHRSGAFDLFLDGIPPRSGHSR